MLQPLHVLIVTLILVAAISGGAQATEPIDIGSRRELFVDDDRIGVLKNALVDS
jgi:hypothetical protein